MVHFVRAFVPRLASVAALLDALRLLSPIDLDDPSSGLPTGRGSLTHIKVAVAAAPVLAKLAWGEPFFLATAASAVGLCAVLFLGPVRGPATSGAFCARSLLAGGVVRHDERVVGHCPAL